MIPANGRQVARFQTVVRDGKPPYWSRHPIIAWDDSGYPLIAGNTRLVRADQVKGFDGIEESDGPPVVAAFPAAPGWRMEYRFAQPDGSVTVSTTPVLGWAVGASGFGHPVVQDDENSVAIEDGNEGKLIAPGEATSEDAGT